jgi:PAS domain S-box-containing protein
MSLVHSPYVPSLVLSGLALLVLAWVAWARRRDVRGGQALTVLAVLGAWWAGALALWVAAGSGTLGADALRLQAAAGVLVPWALLAFALRATRLVERQGVILWGLAVPAAAFAALAFGPIGGLSLWRSLSTRAAFDGSLWVGEATVYGPLAGAFDAILIGVAVAVLALAVVRAPAPRRAPHAWTLAGVVLPVVAAAVVGLGAAVAPHTLPAVLALLPPAAFLLAPAALAVAHGLFGDERTRAGEAADSLPAAATTAAGTRRRELVDHLEQPVLWLDGALRVRYANAAAGLVFRREAGVLGEPAEALFRDLPAMLAALMRRRRAVLEIELSRATGRLRYEAWLTPLREPSGRHAGMLLTLVDSGRLHRAEATAEVVEAQERRHEALLEALHEALRAIGRGESLGLLLDIVLTSAAGALEVPHAALYLHDPAADVLRRRTAVGGFEAREESPLRSQEGLAGQAWASTSVVSAEALPVDGADRDAAERDDAATWAGAAVAVPLRLAGRSLGVLQVARRRADRRPFGPEEVNALQRFAELAAIAVRDARARERAERAEDELAWLDQLDVAIAQQEPDTAVLDLALSAARAAAGFERAVVWLPSPDGRVLEASAWLGLELGPESTQRVLLDGSAPLLEDAFRGGHEIVLRGGGPLPQRLRPSGPVAVSPLMRAAWPVVLPLRGSAGVVGVLVADDQQQGADLDLRLRVLRRIAARAGQALDRARLRQEASCRAAEVERARAQVQAALTAREALLNALPVAYFETDLRGELTCASPELARLAGFDEDVLRGIYLGDLAASGGEGAVTELFGRVLRNGHVARRASWALLARRGAVVPVELSIGLLRGPTGEAAGYFGLLTPRPR